MRYFIVVMMVILCCSGMAVAGQEEYSDPVKPLRFTTGQEFTITLKSNRTTGYQWQLAEALNEGIVKLIITDYKRPEGNLIGAGGKERAVPRREEPLLHVRALLAQEASMIEPGG